MSRRNIVAAVAALIACGAVAGAQQQAPARPLSPSGSTQAQVLGRWVKGDRPQGGKYVACFHESH